MSGRRRVQVHEDARLIGQTSFIFEAGSAFSIDGETTMATGEFVHEDGMTLVEQVSDRGVPELLLGALRRPIRVPRAVASRPRDVTSLPRRGRHRRGQPAARGKRPR